MRPIFFLLIIVFFGELPEVHGSNERVTRILLLGDSTVFTSYLPEEQKYHNAILRELKTLFPTRKVEIINASDNGEFIARYLLSGAYERMRASVSEIDIIVVRFGANDEKRVDAPLFGRQLAALVNLLNQDFPGAQIILETGVYMDPEHYSFDRNKALIPYWQQVRDLATIRRLPLSDVYAAMERETKSGNWDQRIRKGAKGSQSVLDASEDAGKEGDLAWFSNIHPNKEGVRLAAVELASKISLHPEKVSENVGKKERPAKKLEEYEALIGFTRDRLKKAAPATKQSESQAKPLDDLQQSTNLLNNNP